MKVKSGIIYSGLQIIQELADKPMPSKIAIELFRLADNLEKENQYIIRQRQNIVEKYCDKNEDGTLIIKDGNMTITDVDKREQAQKELDELFFLDNEIEDRNITLDDLEKANIELTINQLIVLKEFIKK